MKSRVLTLLSSLLVAVSGIATAKAPDAGSYQVLHSFTGKKGDGGANPSGRMLLLDGWLYGTTVNGGRYSGGDIFKFNPATDEFVDLYDFANVAMTKKSVKKYGCYPTGGLTLSAPNVLSGTAGNCGPANGTAFSFDLTSNTITRLHAFLDDRRGYFPGPALLLDGSLLFGVTTNGGYAGGTVFSVSPSTGAFSPLHFFHGVTTPSAALAEGADGMLYGSAKASGNQKCFDGCGTLFLINPAASGYTELYRFGDGKDGAAPDVAMTADGAGHLFGGTTETKGGFGTIFRINDGTTGEGALGFSTVHVFSGDADGRYLGSEMVLDPASGAFYGVSDNEGTGPNNGTVFKFDPASDVLTVLHTFPIGTKDGAHPAAGLTPDGSGSYYGTTYSGGDRGMGVIFKMTPP